jgi:HK97 gp10 family phage protein
VINLELRNLDGVLDAIEELTDEKLIELEKGIEKACALVERSAKEKAPKDTGELRRSITSKVEKDADGVKGIIYTPLEYAPYVEYGTGLFAENGGRMDVPWNYQDDKGEWHSTSGQHPQPFMRPALNENREKIKRIIKEALKNG